MRLNTAVQPVYTHEGGRASHISPLAELERSVLACLLWENTFYESGNDQAKRIIELVDKVADSDAADLAVKARNEFRLRHVPLLLAVGLAKKRSKLTGKVLAEVVQRPDELAELVKMYWHVNGKKPLSAQIKKGLAKAFVKFDAYQLAKYNRKAEVTLRDVMFMVHPKPKDEGQAAVWKKLANQELEAPDTWEVALSGGADKKESFTRLLSEGRLGYMALLRNLRNMVEAGVDRGLIETALMEGAAKSKALPFRFVSAARAVPQLEPVLDMAMQASINAMERLSGETVLLLDVSYSMQDRVSSRSDLNRLDAACALAILAVGICDRVRVLTFSNGMVEVPPRRGMALRDAVAHSQPNMGTYLRGAMNKLDEVVDYDRLIIFTDEQSHDGVGNPKGTGYLVNVAGYKRGVGYGQLTHISGFSEQIMRFIQEVEKSHEG